MRFSVTAIVAFATSLACVSAQTPDLSQVPSCAIPCFASAVSGSGCSLTDTKCQCTTGRASITDSLLKCTPGRCNTDDLTKVTSAVLGLCAAAGVTITDVPSSLPSAVASQLSGSASRTQSGSATASASRPAAATASTNAAAGTYAGAGAVAMGLLGVFVL